MKKKLFRYIPVFLCIGMLAGCAKSTENNNSEETASQDDEINMVVTEHENMTEKEEDIYSEKKSGEEEEIMQNILGGLSPEDALEYMKNTPDLVIVQVNTAEWKIIPGFTGALWIPHDEMEERYGEIAEGKPVLLHCGAGVVSVPAYETLIEKRPDIPELGYIAGSPHSIIPAYNEWLESGDK